MKLTEKKLQTWKEQGNYQGLITALVNGIYSIRVLAAKLLIDFKNPEVKEALLSALSDKVPTVCEAAYQSLKEFELDKSQEKTVENYRSSKTSSSKAPTTSIENRDKKQNEYKSYSKTSLFKLYIKNKDNQEQESLLVAIDQHGGVEALKDSVKDEYEKKIKTLSKEKLLKEYENREDPLVAYFKDVIMNRIESLGGIDSLKDSVLEEKQLQKEQARLRRKRRRRIAVFSTISILIILLAFFGVNKYQSYSEEKKEYLTAIQDSSLIEMHSFIEKYPDGFFYKKVSYLITFKEYESIKKGGSYLALSKFAQKYSGMEFADSAKSKCDSIYNLFQSDTKLNSQLQKLNEAVSRDDIRLAIRIADDIYSSTPEVSAAFDFLQLSICDTICSAKSLNPEYNPEQPVDDRLRLCTTLSQMQLIAVKYQRYDVAKACLFRSIIELSSYYKGEMALRFHELMQQTFSRFGNFLKTDLETIQKCISLKEDVIEQIQQMEKEAFIFDITDIFLGKSYDDLLADDNTSLSELGRNEQRFIRNTFIASTSTDVSSEIKRDIYDFYGHPEVFEYVASNSTTYINYKLTNLSNSMQSDLQDPLLELINTGSSAQRINAIIALGWIPMTSTIKRRLSELYPSVEPTEDEGKVQKMAIGFVYQKTGIHNNISYLVQNAKSGDYEIASRALSLLRYTRNIIPSSAAIEIIQNVSSSDFFDPEYQLESNLVLEATGKNRKYKVLAQVVENAKYSAAIGEYIFSFASQAYDGSEGSSIRHQWVETAEHFQDELIDLAKSRLFSDNILESKLALQIILLDEDASNQLNIENRFSNELIPHWSKKKYSFFNRFVKIEAKSNLAQQDKYTSYPYYIDYDKAYRSLRNLYYDDVIRSAKMLYYIRFGVNSNRFRLIESFDNPRLITILCSSDSSASFINSAKRKFNSGISYKHRIHYAALLANQGDSEGLKFVLDMLNNSNYYDDAVFYLKYIKLNEPQLIIVRDRLTKVWTEIESLDKLYQRSSEDDSDFEDRERKFMIDKYHVQFHLTSLLAKHSAFKDNLVSEIMQVVQ